MHVQVHVAIKLPRSEKNAMLRTCCMDDMAAALGQARQGGGEGTPLLAAALTNGGSGTGDGWAQMQT